MEKASQTHYSSGEKLLLCQGCTFYGKLHLQGGGSETKPVIISSYDPGNEKTILPVINARGYLAAIQITNGESAPKSSFSSLRPRGTKRAAILTYFLLML